MLYLQELESLLQGEGVGEERFFCDRKEARTCEV